METQTDYKKSNDYVTSTDYTEMSECMNNKYYKEEERSQIISCLNCKNFHKQITDNPCCICNKQFSEWKSEIRQN